MTLFWWGCAIWLFIGFITVVLGTLWEGELNVNELPTLAIIMLSGPIAAITLIVVVVTTLCSTHDRIIWRRKGKK